MFVMNACWDQTNQTDTVSKRLNYFYNPTFIHVIASMREPYETAKNGIFPIYQIIFMGTQYTFKRL